MSEDRVYAGDVADWCERELKAAKETGTLETRPFVQNAQMIIDALREYAKGNLGAVNSGQSVADIKEHLRGLPRAVSTTSTSYFEDSGPNSNVSRESNAG